MQAAYASVCLLKEAYARCLQQRYTHALNDADAQLAWSSALMALSLAFLSTAAISLADWAVLDSNVSNAFSNAFDCDSAYVSIRQHT